MNKLHFPALRTTGAAAAAAALGVLVSAGGARAADIIVNTNNMTTVNDSNCGFGEAVQALNTQAPFNGCIAGNGSNDRILLQAATYQTFTSVNVERDVQIIGVGIDQTNFNTGGALGLRVESPTGAAINVTLTNLTVRDVHPSLPVTCVVVFGGPGGANLHLDQVRATDCSGAGVQVDGAFADIQRSVIDNNPGGGIKVVGGGLFLDQTQVLGCSNSGIYLGDGSSAEIRRSAIENNSGSGINVSGAGLFMYSSLIAGNTAGSGFGGGIDFQGQGNNNIYNSTISGNSAQRGGGIHMAPINGGYLDLYNVTVAFNTVTDRGGGIYDPFANDTPMTMRDSIVAKNTAPTHPDVSGFVNSHRTLHGNTSGNTGNHFDEAGLNNVDPLLGPLMDMGGPTRVRAPLKGSPAIDARPSEGGMESVSVDQRGFPRPIGPNEDLGAYEQGPFENELVAMVQKTTSVGHSVTTSGIYSNGAATWLQSTGTGQFVTYRVPVAQTGNYNVKVRIRKGNNRAIWQLAVATSLGGTYTSVGGLQDHYAATAGTPVEIDLGTFNFGSTGQKYFRFRTTSKNAASMGWNLVADYIKLTKL